MLRQLEMFDEMHKENGLDALVGVFWCGLATLLLYQPLCRYFGYFGHFFERFSSSGKHGPGNELHYQIGREQPNIITKPSSQVRICESADPF